MKRPPIEFKQWGKWRIAWVNRKNLSQCCELLRTNELDGLGIMPTHGSDFQNLSVFEKIDGLAGLVLPSCKGLDLEGLGKLESLEFIVLGEVERKDINLSNLALLNDISIDWSPKLRLPRSTEKLKRLRIDKFKPEQEGVLEICQFANLLSLELVQGCIESLDGVQNLHRLVEVELHHMVNLRSIKHLSETNVEKITITYCKKIADLNSVAGCRRLRVLRYGMSAPLASVAFVERCAALKEFRFVDVDVIDGDMRPLLRLEEFAFTRKKHFSHTERALRLLKDGQQ